jgi:DNA-binding NarL/FixJ family response regulator
VARESKEMSAIKDELNVVQAEIARLRIQEDTLVRLLRKVSGETAELVATPQRKRSSNVKPLVLDIMIKAGPAGATTREVDDAVRAANPAVGTATVGSVLSRLKADGALIFDGERYYERKYAPAPRPFDTGLRAVS